jgi:Protein of unknown function DUF58
MKKILSFIPLTGRGCCLLFALPVCIAFGLQFFDVILTIIGLTLFPLLILILLTGVWTASRLKRNARLQFRGPAFGSFVEAGALTPCALTAEKCWFLPLFTLKTEVHFKESTVQPSTVILRARYSGDLILEPHLTFPHRGNWTADYAHMQIEDVFGITRIKWLHALSTQTQLPVYPRNPETIRFPLMPTSFRAGDEALSDTRRDGEPFDLKRYHPSDGLRRIVWKVFARTGALIARHPEHAMTPEGKSCFFVVAEREDDIVCSAALSYASHLEASGCELFAGCLGIQERPIATSNETLLSLVIESVWDADIKVLQRDLESFWAHLNKQSLFSTNVILMISRRLLTSQQSYEQVLSSAEWLNGKGIKPIFFVVPRLEDLKLTPRGEAFSSQERFLYHWFFDQGKMTRNTPQPDPALWEVPLRDECTRREWGVYRSHFDFSQNREILGERY